MSERLADLRKRVRVAGGLPVFSTTVQRVLELVHARDVPMPEVTRAIEQDPSLAARVLKLANSAFYGLSERVSSLNLALVLLGMRNIQTLVQSLGFLDILGEFEESAPYPGPGFREHCVRSGRAASYLGRLHGTDGAGEEFVAGLIHDLGKLVLYRAYPERVTKDGARLAGLRGVEQTAAEVSIFGLDHAEAGAWAAREWRLPPTIVTAIREHESDPGVVELSELGLIVSAADRLEKWLTTRKSNATDVPENWHRDPILSHPDVTVDGIDEALKVELSILS